MSSITADRRTDILNILCIIEGGRKYGWVGGLVAFYLCLKMGITKLQNTIQISTI